MKNIKITFVLAFLLIAFTSASVQALPVVYFGEDLNPYGNVNECPRIDAYPNALQAQNDFLSNLTGVRVEDFEGFPAGTTTPLTIDFGYAGNATLSGGIEIARLEDNDPTLSGSYPISGNQFFGVGVDNSDFTLEFDKEQAAFGFYAVDLEANPFYITLGYADGTFSEQMLVPHVEHYVSGSVVFYGLIDTENPFTSVSLLGSNNEGYGFDDFTIGTRENVVPEPATLFLLGAGLAGAGALRRRKRKS